MQQQPQMLTGSPTTTRTIAARLSTPRAMLPNREVTSSTISEAFVQFILYCNPAVPPETDTTALREAFQTPPKSGGKSFDTFTLLELIKQLEAKKLKTWAELALKLGVEPPDQEKGESSQKIQQYAVRLKRWMHSMHVDAFFEYLLDRPNAYWSEIPPDAGANAVSEFGRDGVAAEDDMALRALMPQIKPRRGRRGRMDDVTDVPPADELGGGGGGGTGMGSAVTDGWSARPEGRGSVFLFPAVPTWPGGGGAGDMLQTPLTAYPQSAHPQSTYPQSAITPSTRQAFWADEPKSAVTPSKGGRTRRHGAKVVSSAWKGGLGGTGKTRGRPKLNRGEGNGAIGEPLSAFPSSDGGMFRIPEGGIGLGQNQGPAPISALPTLVGSPVSMVDIDPSLTTFTATATATATAAATPPVRQISNPCSRPAKRSRLSLQVPARVGGEVRLATPPPVVMVNGQTPQQHEPHIPQQPQPPSLTPFPPPPPPSQHSSSLVIFTDPTDRTNLPEIETFLINELLTATWFSSNNTPLPPCDVQEASSLATAMISHIRQTAPNKDAFLLHLSALMGSKLLNIGKLKVTRLEDQEKVRCEWSLRVSGLQGGWTMHVLSASKTDHGREGTVKDDDRGWKKRYTDLMDLVGRRDREIADLRERVSRSMR